MKSMAIFRPLDVLGIWCKSPFCYWSISIHCDELLTYNNNLTTAAFIIRATSCRALFQPCRCGFNASKSKKHLKFIIKVFWPFSWVSIPDSHVVSKVLNELTCLLELLQLLLVLFSNVSWRFGVECWKRKEFYNISCLL